MSYFNFLHFIHPRCYLSRGSSQPANQQPFCSHEPTPSPSTSFNSCPTLLAESYWELHSEMAWICPIVNKFSIETCPVRFKNHTTKKYKQKKASEKRPNNFWPNHFLLIWGGWQMHIPRQKQLIIQPEGFYVPRGWFMKSRMLPIDASSISP